MTTRQFVGACKAERDSLFAQYAAPDSQTEVAERLRAAGLDQRQRVEILAALDAALTDAFYVVLMGLDGSASLGTTQQNYRVADEAGRQITPGDGEDFGALAYEIFQGRL